jgi:uncharacterized integral membrane protein
MLNKSNCLIVFTKNLFKILIFFLILIFSACTNNDNVIRFAYQDRVADAPSIIAVKNIMFKNNKLNVKSIRYQSGH